VSEPAFRVERAEPALVPRLHAIAVQSFDSPWSAAAFAEEFASPDAALWVARDAGGEVRGYLVAQRALDEVHVLSLAVEPGARRQGAASALLAVALSTERSRGARIAHLEVRASNPEAVAFYARAGFRSVGRRRRYYPDGDDALLLAAALVPVRRAGGER
jgi:[ribosomal protein S18]-alanine N-acetyltransferase